MREASHLCSVLDDCAAVGDIERLERLEERARMHIDVLCGRAKFGNMAPDHRADADDVKASGDVRAVIWAHVADALYFRRKGIEHRLEGNIRNASNSERFSEDALNALRLYGTRSPRA